MLFRSETIVDEHVTKFLAWQSSLEAAGLLDAFRARLEAERRALLAAHFANADGISESERARFEKLTEELIDRIVQLPSRRLRQARKLRRPLEGLAALRDFFGLDPSDEEDQS